MSRKKHSQARIGKRLRCNRCGYYAPKDLTTKAAENWSGKWEKGRLTLVLCPQCQTPLENAAAEANDAELAVARADGGPFLPDPVLCITGTLEDRGTVLYGRALSTASAPPGRPRTCASSPSSRPTRDACRAPVE